MRDHLAADIPASVVVFLVALPLSMGVGLASGVDPALGLATAVVGIGVAIFGGSHLQISGPSMALSVLVFEAFKEFGPAGFAMIVLVAGAMQVLVGLMGIGRQFQSISPAVIRGMMSGIGVIIILSQFHAMFDAPIPGKPLANLIGIPHTLTDLWKNPAHRNAAGIGALTFVVVAVWDRFKPKKLKNVPGALIAVVLASIVAGVLSLKIAYIAPPDNFLQLFSFPKTSSWRLLGSTDIWATALGLAFVATAETLLCAAAVGRADDVNKTNYDRALWVHGIANMVCGVAGILPLTGVISRSSANVEAGAKTRTSAILQGVGIALVVLLVPGMLALLPRASLAAILIYVGIKLLNVMAVYELKRFGWQIMAIFAVTLVGVVAFGVLNGIVAGLAATGIWLMYQMSHVYFELEKTPDPDGDGPLLERWDLHMHGSATFIGLPKLQDVLDEIPPGIEVHFHFDELEFMDHACLDLLSDFRKRHEEADGVVVVEWDELFNLRNLKAPISKRSLSLPRPSSRGSNRPSKRGG